MTDAIGTFVLIFAQMVNEGSAISLPTQFSQGDLLSLLQSLQSKILSFHDNCLSVSC